MSTQARGADGRFVRVTIDANVAPYNTALGRAANSVMTFGQRHAQAMTTAGQAVAGFGVVAAAGLALSAREAIKWESAWAGVTKTVDGSTTQMQALEDELRSMAKTLPATHGEIAAVAEAAGQLGVAREDVVGFTKVMIDLGVSTNLTADQAATSLARYSNVAGVAASDADRLGATLVALGNAGASTESEILTMGLRIAGAGRAIGLTAAESLGLANSLSSLGIEAEAGGTAISTVLLTIQRATDAGGDELTKFARVAGVSAADFKTAFETDASGALVMFLEGMYRLDGQGQNTTQVMDDLGFSGIRVTDTLRRMYQDVNLVAGSLDLSSDAWRENRALVEEAEKRYATTASQLAVARNNLRDTAITIGDQLLPAIQIAAEGFANFADVVGSMPDPLLQVVVQMGSVFAALGLLGGGLLLVIPQVASTVAAFQTLSAAQPRLASALTKLGSAAALAGIFYATTAALSAFHNASLRAIPGAEGATKALLDMQDAGNTAALDKLFKDLDDGKTEVDSFSEAVRRLTDRKLGEEIGDWSYKMTNAKGDFEQTRELMDSIDEAMAELVRTGRQAEADAWFATLNEDLGGTAESSEVLLGLLPQLRAANDGVENSARQAATSTEAQVRAAAGLAITSDEAAAAVDAFKSALDELFQETFGVQEATDRFVEGLHGLRDAAEQNGTALTGMSQGAIANRDAFRAFTQDAKAALEAMIDNRATADEVAAAQAGLKDQLLEAADAANYSADEVKLYTDYLDQVPGNYQATLSLAGAGAVNRALDEVLSKVVSFDGRTATATIRTINSVTNRVSTQTTRMEADGGFYPRAAFSYANGGEHHVAQIAPAGAWRVWAEDETGGEAYIPLAPAKRTRSVAIAQSVANRFGYDMVPRRPVQYMAMGAVLGGAGGAGSGLPPIDVYVQAVPDGEYVRQEAAVVVRDAQAAQMRQIRSGRRG